MFVRASEFKRRLGRFLAAARTGPVFVESPDQAAVVVLSVSEYLRLQAIDDRCLGEMATQAEKEGFAGPEETRRVFGKLA